MTFILLCTDRLTDGTSPLPERLGREGPPRGQTHLRLDRSLPLAPCYSIFRLNTATCECFPITKKQRCKHLGFPLRFNT